MAVLCWVGLCCFSSHMAGTCCAIDLMQNDIKQCFAAGACIVVVVVMHKSTMASYFPEVGNLNGRNTDMIVL